MTLIILMVKRFVLSEHYLIFHVTFFQIPFCNVCAASWVTKYKIAPDPLSIIIQKPPYMYSKATQNDGIWCHRNNNNKTLLENTEPTEGKRRKDEGPTLCGEKRAEHNSSIAMKLMNNLWVKTESEGITFIDIDIVKFNLVGCKRRWYTWASVLAVVNIS